MPKVYLYFFKKALDIVILIKHYMPLRIGFHRAVMVLISQLHCFSQNAYSEIKKKILVKILGREAPTQQNSLGRDF